MAATVWAFMNQKGGVGKTTSVASVGALMAAERGLRVLLIDLDPQGNLSDYFGVDPNVTEQSVYDLLLNGTDPKTLIHRVHGIDLLPANLDLSGAEIELAGMMMRELRLKNAIVPLLDDYDFILMDCPPSLGLLTVSGLALAGGVVVPMQAEYLALRGLAQLLQTVDVVKTHLNPTLEVKAVLFCMYSPQTNLARDVRAEVERYFPDRVCRTAIRKNVRLAESPSHGLPINLYDPTCSGTSDYRAVLEELLEGEASAKPSAKTLPPVQPQPVKPAPTVKPTVTSIPATAPVVAPDPTPASPDTRTPSPAPVSPEPAASIESAIVDDEAAATRRRLGRGVDDFRRRPIWKADQASESEPQPLPDVEKNPAKAPEDDIPPPRQSI